MNTRVCQNCGHYNNADSWACVQCGSTLGIDTLKEIEDPSAIKATKICLSCEKEVHLLQHTCPHCRGTTFIAGGTGDEVDAMLDARERQEEAAQHVTRGALLIRQGRFKEAEQTLKKALDLNPMNATAHSNMGAVFFKQGRAQEAIPWLEKALALNPTLEGVPQALERAKNAVAQKKLHQSALAPASREAVTLPRTEGQETPYQKQIRYWAMRIEDVQKISTKRSTISILLGIPLGAIAGTLLTIALGALLYALENWLSETVLTILGMLSMLSVYPLLVLTPVLLNRWARKTKQRSIQDLVAEIRRISRDQGWETSEIVCSLVTALPFSPTCQVVAHELDREAYIHAKEAVKRQHISRDMQFDTIPRYDQWKYKEIRATDTQVTIHCPKCGRSSQFSADDFVINTERTEKTGQAIRRLTSGMQTLLLLVAVVLLLRVWWPIVSASSDYGCLWIGSIVLAFGAMLLYDKILVPVLGKEFPIWQVTCQYCQEIFPVASNGKDFYVGSREKPSRV